jgi:hypothetical protein
MIRCALLASTSRGSFGSPYLLESSLCFTTRGVTGRTRSKRCRRFSGMCMTADFNLYRYRDCSLKVSRGNNDALNRIGKLAERP